MGFELYPAPSNDKGRFVIPFSSGGKAMSEPVPLSLHTGPADATSVQSRWGYDWHHLYLEVSISARVDSSQERAWRYGDGMLLTVSHMFGPEPVPLYTSLGLGGSPKKQQVLVVNSCGRWFPPIQCNEVQLKIARGDKQSAYKITVPWAIFPPVHPLLSDSVGLNLTFIRRLPEQRAFYQLCLDPDFDTETTSKRKVDTAVFSPASVSQLHTYSLARRACRTEQHPLELALGLITPTAIPIEMDIAISQDSKLLERYCAAMEVAVGVHRWRLRWAPQRELPGGLYTLEITSRGEGFKPYSKKHQLMLVNQRELSSLEEELEARENDIQFPHRDATQTLLAQLQWFRQECEELPPWELPAISVLAEARHKLDMLRLGSNPLQPGPGLSRRAFRSRLDNELRPYSIYFPRNFSPEKKWPLLVMLHGSGVDEKSFAATPQLHKLADKLGVILLFPHGRDVSGFYLDHCEQDVLEALSVAKKRFPVDWDRVYLAGFSMGGFGTWHTGLRHPGLFKGLAVISGSPCLPCDRMDVKPGYHFTPLDYIDAARSLPLLVIHGTDDLSVPINSTREVVKQLTAQGVNVTYREISGAGHSNFDWYGDLATWLKPLLK